MSTVCSTCGAHFETQNQLYLHTKKKHKKYYKRNVTEKNINNNWSWRIGRIELKLSHGSFWLEPDIPILTVVWFEVFIIFFSFSFSFIFCIFIINFIYFFSFCFLSYFTFFLALWRQVIKDLVLSSLVQRQNMINGKKKKIFTNWYPSKGFIKEHFHVGNYRLHRSICMKSEEFL